jgi:hypothetical protein
VCCTFSHALVDYYSVLVLMGSQEKHPVITTV